GHIDTVELIHVVDAAGRKNVYLEDLVADQIHPDEAEAVRQEAGLEQPADPLLQRAEGRPLARATYMDVVADVVGRPHPLVGRDVAADADGLPAEEEDPLVAARHR